MRVAAVYDIHGSLPALEAVLAEIEEEGVDEGVVGGDVVPGPMPRESLSTLLDLPLPVRFFRGNGENDLLTLHQAAIRPGPRCGSATPSGGSPTRSPTSRSRRSPQLGEGTTRDDGLPRHLWPSQEDREVMMPTRRGCQGWYKRGHTRAMLPSGPRRRGSRRPVRRL